MFVVVPISTPLLLLVTYRMWRFIKSGKPLPSSLIVDLNYLDFHLF